MEATGALGRATSAHPVLKEAKQGTHIQGRGGEQHMGGLGHVSSVQAVVVGHV